MAMERARFDETVARMRAAHDKERADLEQRLRAAADHEREQHASLEASLALAKREASYNKAALQKTDADMMDVSYSRAGTR
jgi:hypothetical protein